MPFVQVVDGRLDSERLQRPDPADPEQRVLREPDRAVPLVEPRGRPAARRVVLGQLGVEQVERHAADVDAPDLERRSRRRRRGRTSLQRPAVGAGDPRHRQALRIVLDPVLLLPAVQVEPLPEVAAPVEEADRDQRQRLVARLLEDVAGEHAEPARVDRQRRVDAVLGAEERDRPVDPRPRPRRARQIGVHLRGERERRGRGSTGSLAARSCVDGQRSPRKRTGFSPESSQRCGLMSRKRAAPSRGPRPAVVVGDARQRAQALGQPLGEALRRARRDRRFRRPWSRPRRLRCPSPHRRRRYRRVSRRAAAGRRG